jgi:hypothetical protein
MCRRLIVLPITFQCTAVVLLPESSVMNGMCDTCAGNPPAQNKERDHQEEAANAIDRAFDRILEKGGQLSALLALMIQTAVDEEVLPVHRAIACQLAWELTSEILTAATAALAVTT